MNASRIRHALTFAIVLALPLGAAAQETPTELSVSEVQLGSSLDRGRVESPTTTFTHADGRIYAVVQVQNPARTETRVRVSLERVDGPTRSGVLLDIPARPRYRTVVFGLVERGAHSVPSIFESCGRNPRFVCTPSHLGRADVG